MQDRYIIRDQTLVDSANKELRMYSKCFEIRPSNLRSDGKPRFGMFATQDIPAGKIILAAPHPMTAMLETVGRCADCFRDLQDCGSPKSFSCCPGVKYCSERYQIIAFFYYHQATWGKDFSSVIDRAQKAWGDKNEESLLSRLVSSWDGKIKHGYMSKFDQNYIYPDHALCSWLGYLQSVCNMEDILLTFP